MPQKRRIENQKYENYWKITLEYSDFLGKPFNDVLTVIVKYIDNYSDDSNGLDSKHYQKMQKEIGSLYHKANSASTRKSINQMFKLGFINNKAKSYHFLTKEFLAEKNAEQKRLLFSRIVYDNSSFSRSFKNEAKDNEIKFLVKTIEKCGRISKEDLLAIMFCDIHSIDNDFLNRKQLNEMVSKITTADAKSRKYNQCNYLWRLCESLSNIYIKDGYMSLDPNIVIEKEEKTALVRDPYLQRLYKTELINEEKEIFNSKYPYCVVEQRAYPVLIASHIKPYRVCEKEEQFDRNNGLLLSKNFDSMFDLGYITFDNDGSIISSPKLNEEVAIYVQGFKLDAKIYNEQRKKYMIYHRENVFMK